MNLNKAYLIGRLTQDPEMRSTQSGQNVTTINIATNRVWNDASTGRKEATEYHRVVAWGRLAEIAGQYLKKGGLVMIEGRIQTRSWTDQGGNKKYTTEIVAENLQLGPRSANSGAGGYQSQGDSPRSYTQPAAVRPAVSHASQADDADIPIIDENEPVNHGLDESEVKISEKDLPF